MDKWLYLKCLRAPGYDGLGSDYICLPSSPIPPNTVTVMGLLLWQPNHLTTVFIIRMLPADAIGFEGANGLFGVTINGQRNNLQWTTEQLGRWHRHLQVRKCIQSTLYSLLSLLFFRCGDFSYRVNHTPILPIPSLDNINDTSPYLTEEDLSILKGAEHALHRQLVVKRNRKMAQQIELLLESDRKDTFFLGLGAGQWFST